MKSVRERIEMKRRIEMVRGRMEMDRRRRWRTRPESAKPVPESEPDPEPSCVSFMCDRSKDCFLDLKRVSDKNPEQQLTPESDGPEPGPEPEPSCVSMKSDRSKDWPVTFKDGRHSVDTSPEQQLTPESDGPEPGPEPEPSCVSMKSDRSKDWPETFKDGRHSVDTSPEQQLTPESAGPGPESDPGAEPGPGPEPETEPEPGTRPGPKSEHGPGPEPEPDGRHSVDQREDQEISDVPSGQSTQQHQTHLDSIFMGQQMETPQEVVLGILENLGTDDFEKFKWYLQGVLKDFPAIPKSKLEKVNRVNTVDTMFQTYSRNTINVTRIVLVKINQNDLVENLSNIIYEPAEILAACQRKVKSKLHRKFQRVFEGIVKAGNKSRLEKMFTEIYITKEGTAEDNAEHEVRQIETASWKPDRPETTITCEDIFKTPPGREEPIRTVMTKGVAGIGKTVLTQKFTLDWAEGNDNQDIQFTFPFTFRELNVLKEKKYSLVELVHYFFSETKEAGICRFEEFQVVFIFDGLDECRPPLDFLNTEILTDITKSTSVGVLLTNLIRGKLLPSARLWITTRPAAANQIPPECVDMVTEVRGFTDPQKEEYFRKRFRDEEQADRIISHIKTSQSLHIMCSDGFSKLGAQGKDVEQLLVVKEEVPPEQQECSSSVDQQEPEPPPHIKEEQEELWSSQEGEQLQGLEEADITEFPFTPVPEKSEDDEEEDMNPVQSPDQSPVLDPDLTIVLMGRTGVGKSASGNTILGRPAFVSKLSFKSVTKQIREQTGNVLRKQISVVDTPGILDSEDTKKEIKDFCQSLLSSSRRCLFLVVFRVGRITKEDQEAVQAAMEVLGPRGMEKSYLLFTGGDMLQGRTVEDLIYEGNEEDMLPDVVRRFAGAYHLFDNRRDDEEQVRELLQKSVHLNTQETVDDSRNRRIVLLGLPGAGKSSSENTILRSGQFKPGGGFDSVTTETVSKSAIVEGHQVTVVDTPGITDEVLTPQQLFEEIMKSVVEASPGPHAFVIVVRIGRITGADKKLFELLEKLFSRDALKYSMVLFTHGDELGGRSIDDLIRSDHHVSDLVSMCGGRFCVFDNKTIRSREQVREFLSKVDEMVSDNGGEHYTDDMFRMVQTFINEERDKSARPRLSALSRLSARPRPWWSFW